MLYWNRGIAWSAWLDSATGDRHRSRITPVAAIGLAVIVFLGAVLHVRRKENRDIRVNIGFLVLAVFVAMGRMWF